MARRLQCYFSENWDLTLITADMVAHPGEYHWCSYHTNAYGKPGQLITPHALYLQQGKIPKYTD